MTPEKLKEIEATAQEAFKNGTYNDKMYDWLQENRRAGYITGALSLQPELDTLQKENDRLRERVRELEEWISVDNPPEVGEFVLVYNTEGATLIGRLLNNGWAAIFLDGEKLMGELTALFWKNLPQPPSTALLTKPDSTGGGEKGNVYGFCMKAGCKRPATKDYNGHGHYVCDLCYDFLNREFDREYS